MVRRLVALSLIAIAYIAGILTSYNYVPGFFRESQWIQSATTSVTTTTTTTTESSSQSSIINSSGGVSQSPPSLVSSVVNTSGLIQSKSTSMVTNGGASTTCNSKKSATQKILEFNWTAYRDDSMDRKKSQLQELFPILVDLITMPPPVPLNMTCEAQRPPLPDASRINCTGFSGLSGQKRKNVSRVVLAIKLGLDADQLEIMLHELHDVVDFFALTESIYPHRSVGHDETNHTMFKPLVWDILKEQDRFRPYLEQVLHFVMDDADTMDAMRNVPTGDRWQMERAQEFKRWKKIELYNNVTGVLRPDDLIGFVDVDEIVSRDTIYRMKHCHLASPSVDVGIWFPMVNMDNVFQTDHPPKGKPASLSQSTIVRYSLGSPCFYEWKNAVARAQSKPYFVTRLNGRSKTFVLGGVHLSNYQYMPHRMMKELLCTECRGFLKPQTVAKLIRIVEGVRKNDSVSVRHVLNQDISLVPVHRLRKLKMMLDRFPAFHQVAYHPWFFKCNPKRYPSYFGQIDRRLVGPDLVISP